MSNTAHLAAIVMLGVGGIFAGGIVWYAWERVWIWRRLTLPEYATDFRRSLRKADPAMPIHRRADQQRVPPTPRRRRSTRRRAPAPALATLSPCPDGSRCHCVRPPCHRNDVRLTQLAARTR
jgi:hypothetical protein